LAQPNKFIWANPKGKTPILLGFFLERKKKLSSFLNLQKPETAKHRLFFFFFHRLVSLSQLTQFSSLPSIKGFDPRFPFSFIVVHN